MTESDEDLEEQREADALAKALERGHTENAPIDALATGALLRSAWRDRELDPARKDAILADALLRARPPRANSTVRWRLFGLLGFAAAGAASFVFFSSSRTSDLHGAATTLPAPPRSLLQAELAATTAGSANLSVVVTETSSYRVAVYERLKERYRP